MNHEDFEATNSVSIRPPSYHPPRSIGSDGCQGPIDVGHRGRNIAATVLFFNPGAIENGHGNSGCTHEKWVDFPVRYVNV